MELSNEQREYVLELLRNAHSELLHELHHTDARSFARLVKQRLALNEQLTRELENVPQPA